MTTLILQSAGAAAGTAFGGPFGAILGRALGGFAGQAIDRQLFGKTVTREGARLSDMPGLSSSEGIAVPRVYGRARIGGQLIWSTRFLETVESHASGGKGLGGAPSVATKDYIYHANLAIGLCEGPIAFVRRIWADGKLIDISKLTIRIYRGDETQDPDPLIIAKEGIDAAPAYRGLAYLVFEHFPLADFGNRIPQFSFEIVKPVTGLNLSIRSINLIPGAGEFMYDPDPVTSVASDGTTKLINRHQLQSTSDFEASVDQLLALCPNLQTVQLVVSWFGDDLRAGECRIMPRVESGTMVTRETEWICAGHDRHAIPSVSQIMGRPAYGGTPSDASVLRAVKSLKDRGLRVVIYPFVMMDIAAGNQLEDPWTGTSGQPVYPWRGRITTNRAASRPDTTDATALVDQECSHFFGSIALHHMARQGSSVVALPDEWSYRRFIFHYAKLLEGEGLDGIVIGSELRGLTRLRNASGQFPAVDHLIAIASALRAALPASVEIIYAADWSEYGSYVTSSGDVRFPLDRLFAHPSISAVAIDAYWPLTDWRDGIAHKDRAIAKTIYDRTYLTSRFGAGEDFDWYYRDIYEGIVPVTYQAQSADGIVTPLPDLTASLQNKDCDEPAWGEYGQSLIADLGRSAHIRAILVAPISSNYSWGGLYLANVDIYISENGVTWTYCARTPDAVPDSQLTRIVIGRVARFVKLKPTYMRPNGAELWIGLSEFEVEIASDRDGQLRTPITDGAWNEPWIYRSKDLVSWWSNAHHERIGGVRLTAPTAWIPKSKPIYLTEFGCPAVDRGSNAPNVFADPKSSETAYPPYSRGTRDDLIQRRTLEAVYERFDPASENFIGGCNPLSPLYGAHMLDPARIALWAFDARPFPEFPSRSDVWSDGANYNTGHWLNGRLEGVSLDRLLGAILHDFELPPAELAVDQFLDGYVIDRPVTARGAIEPLAQVFGFESAVSSGQMHIFGHHFGAITPLGEHDVLPLDDKGYVEITRAQENELPREVRIGFSDADRLYRSSTVTSRRLSGGARGSVNRDAPVVLRSSEAQRLADLLLFDVWTRRETVKLRLRPGLMIIEAGDLINLDTLGHRGLFRVERITDSLHRIVEARMIDPYLVDLAAPANSPVPVFPKPVFASAPQARLLSLPPLTSSPVTVLALAASAMPWSGALTIWRSVEGAAFAPFGTVTRSARIGKLIASLGPGPVWCWDLANKLVIELAGPALSSRNEPDALSAKPAFAIENEDGDWEIISYQHVDLIGENTYRVSRLLRGLGGTEHLASRPIPQGQTVIYLDDAIQSLATGADHLGETWAWRIVAAGLEVSDPAAVEIVASIDGLALKPLAPVHLAACRSADGIVLSWIRRARENADNWSVADIALDEADERYEIEILSDDHVVRMLQSQQPFVMYRTADEVTDFGVVQTGLHVRIFQLSRAVGRGAPAETRLIIR